jgi:short-subunit dehydrogenase
MKGPICLITGVGSGLGLELAALLASEYMILGVSRHYPDDPRWKAIQDTRSGMHIAGDVADTGTVKSCFDVCAEKGHLRLVINCAGTGVFGPAGSYSEDDVTETLKGNLIGTILFSDASFRSMKETGGTIVNVMSTAAHVGRANESVYCSAKWGARGYTESLRLEARTTKVKVVAVYPGGMNTRFWHNARKTSVDSAKFVDSSKFMDPLEVAQMIVVALKSHSNSYVSDLIINRFVTANL